MANSGNQKLIYQKQNNWIGVLLLLFHVLFSHVIFAQFEPSILFYNGSNQLVYVSDNDGNHIPDFSYAGYKNGETDLPILTVVKEISPVVGDNTAHIQAAIDEVEALPLNANGHRGALLLLPGEYRVNGVLTISADGVVLRGSGDGADAASNTIIVGVGNTPSERTLITVGTGNKPGFKPEVAGTRKDIISPYVPAGSRTFEVTDASVFNIGDNIIIKHPSTAAWLDKVENGGVATDNPWNPGEIDLVFNRHIINIVGNKIQVATPIYDVLDRSLSQSFVYKYNGNSQIKECGIEDLRIFIESSGSTSRNHVKTGINLIGVDNSWVKGVTALRMSDQGIKLDEATRCSIIDTNVLEMHGPISGGWRYNFEVTDFCNNILFKNCTASNGRHTFVANGASDVNGIVFTNCSSTGDYTRSESHRRWGQGILWDNITWQNTNVYGILGLHNRGSYGTGHGWTLTNGVAWNIDAPSNQIVVQKPPIGQNYAIGCDATVNGSGPFVKPVGYIEGTGESLRIQSLYAAQLEDRINHGVLPDTPGKLFPNDFKYTETEKYLELTWHDVSIEETNYILERSADGINFQTLATLPADTESYTDTDLQRANYYYRVKATNAIGTSPASNTVQTNDFQGQTTYYVKSSGLNTNDGLSDENAFFTITHALSAAAEGDKIIVVGSINQYSSATIDKTLTIEGQGNAIISASGSFRMFNITSAGKTITFNNITFQNANAAVWGSTINLSVDSNLIIDGCAFMNNNADNSDGSVKKGGAIFASGSGDLTISNSLFNGNSATRGGAISVESEGRNLTVSQSTFVNNTASNDGGAIYTTGNNTASSITNTTFFNNGTTGAVNQSKGGAIRIEGIRPFTIENSLIYGNYATDAINTVDSDIGIGNDTNIQLSFTNSITKKVLPVLSGNDSYSTSIIEADLSTSNLRFDATLGKVIYDNVTSGEHSPIDFGTDGNDVGSWDSEFTLSTDFFSKSKVSIYVNHNLKTIEIVNELEKDLTLILYTISGTKVLKLDKIINHHSVDIGYLNKGVYILAGKNDGKIFSKKLLIR